MQLVPDDRSADRAAPALILRVGLRQPFLLREEVLGRQTAILEEPEGASPKIVRARFGDGVDHRSGGAAVLRIVLPGNDLELLDRLDRRARLRACALPDHVVVVVAAIE